jgi:hypothetical protein
MFVLGSAFRTGNNRVVACSCWVSLLGLGTTTAQGTVGGRISSLVDPPPLPPDFNVGPLFFFFLFLRPRASSNIEIGGEGGGGLKLGKLLFRLPLCVSSSSVLAIDFASLDDTLYS